MVTFQDYLDTLQSGTYVQKIKIVLLREDETPREEITILIGNSGGTLSVNRANGVRRTVNLNIMNLDNTYIPNPESFWVHQKFMLYLCLEINGEDYWLPQGVFVLDDPSVSSNFSESLISIKGVDKFGMLNQIGGELGYTYIINTDTDIISAITDTLALSNDPKTPIIDSYLIGFTTPYTMTYEPSSKIGDVLIDLAQLYSCSIYFNEVGQLVVERDAEDDIKSSLWDFTTNDFTYLGAVNTYKWSDLFNAVRVVGSNINGSDVSYKATNENLSSSTSVPNLGFERIYYYYSDTLDTEQKCQDLAEYILRRKTAVQNEVQINSIAMYHLNPDEIITLTDNNLGLTKERYIINDFNLQLQIGGQLTISTVKSKEIPYV